MKYILVLAILLYSCNVEKHQLKGIIVSYIPGIIESPYSNSCDQSISDWKFNRKVIDTIITDKDILIDVENQLRQMKQIDTAFPVDGRIQCQFYFSNDSASKLCLGSLIGTIYNGQQVLDNSTLNYLLKKHSGYYYYIPFELVLEMPEIRAYPERSNEMMQEETNFYKLGEPDISGDSLIEINDTKSKKFK